MGKIAAIIAFALLVVACHHAEPACVEQPEAQLASCEGDEAPEGYEWRVSCDSGGGEWGNRYLSCTELGYDEAAVCGVAGPHCLTGDEPRCVLVPCDGGAHIGRNL